jgi:hypothetical protein
MAHGEPLRSGPLSVHAPRREPRLAGGQGMPVKWVIIGVPWYHGSTARISAMPANSPATEKITDATM